jgi:hypothetical protein
VHSAIDSATGREDAGTDEQMMVREAQSLLNEHGEEADVVAARRADAHFRSGDAVAGTRWLKVFRRIALAHRGRVAG